MNTIDSTVHMAMDGQTLPQSVNAVKSKNENNNKVIQQKIAPSAADVTQKFENNIAETKADMQELQRITQIVAGNKLQFNVNKELEAVIVSVIDSETDQVIKQIPSEDMVKLKLRIRQAIGTLFDELV